MPNYKDLKKKKEKNRKDVILWYAQISYYIAGIGNWLPAYHFDLAHVLRLIINV